MIARVVMCVALLAAVVMAAGDEKIANECSACKTSLEALQQKAVTVMASAKYKSASSRAVGDKRDLLESGFASACDAFQGWATSGVDKDLKYMKFGGTIGGGMTLTNLSMGPHVDAQLKKACKQLLTAQESFIVDELLKVKRVYDADIASACDAACGAAADAEDRVDL